MSLQIKIADSTDAMEVAKLILQLIREISHRCNDQHFFHIEESQTAPICERLISENCYTALLAVWDDEVVGVCTLAESFALYASGRLGIVQEFYVVPAYRSRGIGKQLINTALTLGKQRGWKHMELCTPPLPQFSKTLEFYEKYGFVPVGGRKMRR